MPCLNTQYDSQKRNEFRFDRYTKSKRPLSLLGGLLLLGLLLIIPISINTLFVNTCTLGKIILGVCIHLDHCLRNGFLPWQGTGRFWLGLGCEFPSVLAESTLEDPAIRMNVGGQKEYY